MKHFTRIGLGLIVAALLAGPFLTVVQAEAKKKTRFYAKVMTVDSTDKSITITLNDKGDTKQYTVDKFTAISVNGKAGKLEDVQSDMKVDVSVKADGKTLTKLTVTDPPEEKEKKGKK